MTKEEHKMGIPRAGCNDVFHICWPGQMIPFAQNPLGTCSCSQRVKILAVVPDHG
jgi:hypothetical protein